MRGILQEDIENQWVDKTDFVKAYRKTNPRDYTEEIELEDGSKKQIKVSAPGIMFVRLCLEQLREIAITKARGLAGTRHAKKNYKYFVSKVECEAVKAAKEKHAARVKTILKNNFDNGTTDNFHFRGNDFFVNGELQVPTITPPSFQDICTVIKEQRPALDAIELLENALPLVRDNNEFRAYAIRTRRMEEIRLGYIRVHMEVPDAAHVILAYKLNSSQGNCDDGEYKAGYKLLRILQTMKIRNIAIFVTRKSNGQQLGPKRFQYITDIAKTLLTSLEKPPAGIPALGSDADSVTSSPGNKNTRKRRGTRGGRNTPTAEETVPKTV